MRYANAMRHSWDTTWPDASHPLDAKWRNVQLRVQSWGIKGTCENPGTLTRGKAREKRRRRNFFASLCEGRCKNNGGGLDARSDGGARNSRAQRVLCNDQTGMSRCSTPPGDAEILVNLPLAGSKSGSRRCFRDSALMPRGFKRWLDKKIYGTIF